MAKLIIPKNYVKDIEEPLIFLAGPIKGAPNWQDIAINYLFSKNKNLVIVSPRKGVREEIANYIVKGNENYFSRQRLWERYYLDIASKKGVILFWLPEEEQHDCNKVYGAMTRLELGQWMTHYKYNNSIKFIVGSDGKFPELKTIACDLELDTPNKIIYDSLERTCLGALSLIKNNIKSV